MASRDIEILMRARRPFLQASLSENLLDMEWPMESLPEEISTEDSDRPTMPPLPELFPDLDVFSGPVPSVEARTNARHAEGWTSSIHPAQTSRIMSVRPVFVSNLKPSQNLRGEEWGPAR